MNTDIQANMERLSISLREPSFLLADWAAKTPVGEQSSPACRPDITSSLRQIFLLVPQVKLSKRLDRDAERALDSVPGLIVANYALTAI